MVTCITRLIGKYNDGDKNKINKYGESFEFLADHEKLYLKARGMRNATALYYFN